MSFLIFSLPSLILSTHAIFLGMVKSKTKSNLTYACINPNANP
jgi:hypothetical protein